MLTATDPTLMEDMPRAASPRPATIVLTNGAWHGSWCWNLVLESLAARRIPAVACELDGFGGLRAGSPQARWARPFDLDRFLTEPSPVASVTVSSAASSLVRHLEQIGNGQPCVLVAHSLGGVVATAAAELAPHLISDLIYVAALAPVHTMPAAGYNSLPEMHDTLLLDNIVADPATIGALRCDIGDPRRKIHARQTFYNDVDDDLADAALSLLSSDAPAAVGAEAVPVSRARYGTVRHTYVVCLRDNAVRPALQRRMITEIDEISETPTVVHELDSSHSPFLSQPAALAAVIESVLRV
jgi:pimeloyl-ACP methyl ester carboxylesterase